MHKKDLLIIVFSLTIVVALASATTTFENSDHKKLFSSQAQVERLSRFEKHRRQSAPKYVRPLKIVFDYSKFNFDNPTTAAYLRNIFGKILPMSFHYFLNLTFIFIN